MEVDKEIKIESMKKSWKKKKKNPKFDEFLAQWVECSPMARETRVQSQVESYQRLKNGTWCRFALHSAL